MNILHLRSSSGFYGAENVIIQLASRQQSKDIFAHVGIISIAGQHCELLDRCMSLKIDSVLFPCKGMVDLNTLLAIRNQLQLKKIDILCCHDYKATVLGYFASLGIRVKRVAINHLWDDIDFKLRLYEQFEGVLYNLFDHVIAVSDPVAEDVRPFLINKRKLTVISNGIDVDYYRNSSGSSNLRKKMNLSDADIVIGVVGRLAAQKGHSYLISTAAELIPKYTNLKFVFWGQGHLEEQLKTQVKTLELDNHVLFAGVSSNMPEVYESIDIFAMPSLSEGMPMALLEAMSAGVLVLATPVGDIPKILHDGETGFLLPLEDTVGIGKVLSEVLEMAPNEKARVARNGQKYIQNHYSADSMANNYFELLKSLL